MILAIAAIIPAILWPDKNTATRLNSVASTEHVIFSVELKTFITGLGFIGLPEYSH